jgi:hypothetical protein
MPCGDPSSLIVVCSYSALFDFVGYLSTDTERDRLIAGYTCLYDEGDALKTRVVAAKMEMIQATAGKVFIATLVRLTFDLYCHVLNRRPRIVLKSLWTRWPPLRLA